MPEAADVLLICFLSQQHETASKIVLTSEKKMAEIATTLGSGRLDEFSPVGVVADELGVHPTTLKNWLKERRVKNVRWGHDSRGWTYIEKVSIPLLKQYKNRVHVIST